MPSHIGSKIVLAFVAAVALSLLTPPSRAEAQDHSAQVSFLARMMIDVTTHQLSIEDEFLIRLPVGERVDRAPRSAATDVRTLYSTGLVALVVGGLDMSSEEERDGAIRLQLKPNFGRRGGLLRCTFRF